MTNTTETTYRYRELSRTVWDAARLLHWTDERRQAAYELYRELLTTLDTKNWMIDSSHKNLAGEPSIWMTDRAWEDITTRENEIWETNRVRPRPHFRRGACLDDYEDETDETF